MAETRQPTSRLVVPKEYAGQWIAWNHARTKIIANGSTFAETKAAAERSGETDPLFDKVPRRSFVGGRP